VYWDDGDSSVAARKLDSPFRRIAYSLPEELDHSCNFFRDRLLNFVFVIGDYLLSAYPWLFQTINIFKNMVNHFFDIIVFFLFPILRPFFKAHFDTL